MDAGLPPRDPGLHGGDRPRPGSPERPGAGQPGGGGGLRGICLHGGAAEGCLVPEDVGERCAGRTRMQGDLFELPVAIGNVTLRNPFIVASGPTVKTLEQLARIEQCGWGAASTKQTYNPRPYINYDPRYRWLKKEKLHIFTAEHRLDMETGLRLIEDGRK